MINVLSNRKVYAGEWSVKESRDWNSSELAMVTHGEVIPSSKFEGKKCMCFHLVKGGKVYYPLTKDSNAEIGESFTMKETEYVVLEKPGETDCEMCRVK